MACKEQQGKFLCSAVSKRQFVCFIETTANIADANPADFLYTDQIQFDSGANQQNIELVTLIQDAVFLYPQRFADGTKKRYLLENKKLKVLFG
jgi:hypothetical protein